jgi:hypothetical protein
MRWLLSLLGACYVNVPFAHSVRSCSVIAVLLCALLPSMHADPVPVRQASGAIHGFLEMRSEDGRVVASGDVTRVVRGDRITSRTVFRFRDGSVDDETTVFSQRRTFQLISYRHIQKGASFPQPMDLAIDMKSGQVTVHSTGKDGKAEDKIEHLDLPADLANGLVPMLVENMHPDSGATITVGMVVATPKPRLVKLEITNVGEDKCFVAGSARKAIHYEIKIDLGGVAGVVAPIIGKAPPRIQIWTIGGTVTTFAREYGPLYAEGPMMTIQLASPTWPSGAK